MHQPPPSIKRFSSYVQYLAAISVLAWESGNESKVAQHTEALERMGVTLRFNSPIRKILTDRRAAF